MIEVVVLEIYMDIKVVVIMNLSMILDIFVLMILMMDKVIFLCRFYFFIVIVKIKLFM